MPEDGSFVLTCPEISVLMNFSQAHMQTFIPCLPQGGWFYLVLSATFGILDSAMRTFSGTPRLPWVK